MYFKLIILILVLLYMLFLKGKYRVVGSGEYNKARKKLAVFTAILLILQSGLRHVGVGPDTYQYMMSFQDRIQWTWPQVFQNFIDVYQYGEGKDAGYNLLVKLFSEFSSDYQIFLLFVAVVVFVPMVRFIYKNTNRIEDIWFALLLYLTLFYSFFSVTGIRQAIATGLCLWAVEYIKERKMIAFLVCVIIGGFIHKSALLFLPFYWIAHIKHPHAIFLGSLCVFPVMVYLGNAFTLHLALISGSENYLGYAEEETVGAYNLIIFYFFISIMGFIRYWKDKEWMERNSYIQNAVSLGIFFLPLTLNSANLVRVVQYYSIFLLVFIGHVVRTGDFKRNILLYNTVRYVLVGVLTYKLLTTPADYAFFWQDMIITNN